MRRICIRVPTDASECTSHCISLHAPLSAPRMAFLIRYFILSGTCRILMRLGLTEELANQLVHTPYEMRSGFSALAECHR